MKSRNIFLIFLTKRENKQTVQKVEVEENEGLFFYIERKETKSKGTLRGTQNK
jgi:hypothetical protein